MENVKTSGGRGIFELLVQLITALAVLAGIYLVMVELRQGREISTLEMIHKTSITEIEHDSKIYGETLAETLTNACLNGDGLTELDKTRLNYYFQNRMRQVVMAYSSAEIGSFQKGISFMSEWEFFGLQYINEILSYKSGKEWLKTDPYWGDEEIAKSNEIVSWVQSHQGIPPYGSACDNKKRWGDPSV
ncbi:MAG: hypothetical protein ACJ0RG_08100 [Candidatus Azotimanducaceae bacterium]